MFTDLFIATSLLFGKPDTVKIPAIVSSEFQRSVTDVVGFYPSAEKDDSLSASFNGRILFKEFYFDRRSYPKVCPMGKYSVFIGYKNDTITIGLDLNQNKLFDQDEISTMPGNNKRILTYHFLPAKICGDSSFLDSIVIHLIPFVNQVRYKDVSAEDTMLQITGARGFVKEFKINDSMTIMAHTSSIQRKDNDFFKHLILKTNTELSVFEPDRDLIRSKGYSFAVLQNPNKDTLFLEERDPKSYYKIESIDLSALSSLGLLNLRTSESAVIRPLKKYLLLDFWGTWCSPCIKSLPSLDSLNAQYGKEIQFVSICIDNTKNIPLANQLLKGNKSEWEQYFLYDNGGNLYDTLKKFAIKAYPTYLLIDSRGKLLRVENFISEVKKDFLDLKKDE